MAKINLEISKELTLKLEKKIEETDFKSIKEYINYILNQITSNINIGIQEEAYTKEEEGAMRERLKEMGYI